MILVSAAGPSASVPSLPASGLPWWHSLHLTATFVTVSLWAAMVALALSLAWLFVTAFQRPWYDVMVISLLALYSASKLDWVILIRLLAGATVYAQAIQSPAEPHWLYDLVQFDGSWLTPAVRLLAVVALVWLCVSGRWGWRSRSVVSSGQRPALLPVT
jgi:hypothetical protein